MNNKLAIGVGAVIVGVIAAGLIIWLVGRGGGDSPPGQGETSDPNATPVVGDSPPGQGETPDPNATPVVGDSPPGQGETPDPNATPVVGDSPPGQGETSDPNATPVVGATQTTSKTPRTPSGDSESEELAYAKGVPEPGDLLWRLRVGRQGYAGSPVVLDGVIYEASYEDGIGQYHAIEAISGKPLWRFQVEGRPLRPSVSEGFAFFSTDAGHLYGLDAGTGELLWRNSVSGEMGAPVSSGNVVYVKAVVNFDDFIHAFERSGGDLLWKANVNDLSALYPVDGAVVYIRSGQCVEARDATSGKLMWEFCPPEGSVSLDGVWGDEVYGSFARRDRFFVLDAATGDVLHQVNRPPGAMVYEVFDGVAYGRAWSRLTAMEVSTRAILWTVEPMGRENMNFFPTPIVRNGTIYFTGGSSLHAIDSATGQLLWKISYGGSEDPRPVVSDNAVYIDVDDQLLALDPSKGHLLWKSNPSDFVDSIAVSDDVVYMRTRNYLYAYADSRNAPNIAALSDNPVGELLWRQADEGHIGSPVLSNDSVVARSENGILSSFDQQTGDLQWTSRIGGPFQPPVVSGDRVYTGSGENRVYALNASNGEPVWSYEADGRYAFVTSPAVDDGVLYFGARTFDSYRFYLLAVNELSTGPQKWSYDFTWGMDFVPTVADGVVYVVSDGTLYALDTSTAELLWQGGSRTPPAILDDIVYASSGQDREYLVAFQARTGDELWSYRAGARVSAPVANGDTVFFGSEDNNVHALAAKTGELLWKFDAGDWVMSRPAVSEGVVYFGSFNAQLFALDAISGELLWTYKLKDSVRTSPAASDGVVYIGTGNYLYALRGPGE